MSEPPKVCPLCPHEFDPHVVIPLGETALDGGLIYCHVDDCDCVTTWSLDDEPRPPMPDPETVERLRDYAHHKRLWSS